MSQFFNYDFTAAKSYLNGLPNVWQFGVGLKNFIFQYGQTLGEDYVLLAPTVWAHRTAKIASSAYIVGPTVIMAGCEIRHCAYIRGGALLSEGCVVGNSCEVKNSILFDGAKIPHFNYVGDSILGHCAHMGAGAITSNVRSDKGEIFIDVGAGKVNTRLKKLGALLGDNCEVGCNAVLCPGSAVGKNSVIYPLARVRGYVPPATWVKG